MQINNMQINNMEQNISNGIDNKEVITVDESLMQQLADIKVEIFLNKSAQYLLSTERKQAVNFS